MSQSDAERRAIQAIRDADPARILTSQDGYALTVGRLCELALSTSAPQGLAKYIGNRQPENTSPHSETPAIPDGMVLVPREPTPKMVEAGDLFFTNASFKSVSPAQIKCIYRDMLAAAPSPDVGPSEQGGAK